MLNLFGMRRTRSNAKEAALIGEPGLLALKAHGEKQATAGMWCDLAEAAACVPDSHRRFFPLTDEERARWMAKDATLTKEVLASWPEAVAFSMGTGLSPSKQTVLSPLADHARLGQGQEDAEAKSKQHKSTYAAGYALGAGEKKSARKNAAKLAASGKRCYAVSSFGSGKLADGTDRAKMPAKIFENYMAAYALFKEGSGHKHRAFESSQSLSCYTRAAQWLIQERKWSTEDANAYLKSKNLAPITTADAHEPAPIPLSTDQKSGADKEPSETYSDSSESEMADPMEHDPTEEELDGQLALLQNDPANDGEGAEEGGTQPHAEPEYIRAPDLLKSVDMDCAAGANCCAPNKKIVAGTTAVVFCSNLRCVFHPGCALTALQGASSATCPGCEDTTSALSITSAVQAQATEADAEKAEMRRMMNMLAQQTMQMNQKIDALGTNVQGLITNATKASAAGNDASPAIETRPAIVIMITGFTPNPNAFRDSNERAWNCIKEACGDMSMIKTVGFGGDKIRFHLPFYIVYNPEASDQATRLLAAVTQAAEFGQLTMNYNVKARDGHPNRVGVVRLGAKILDRPEDFNQVLPTKDWLLLDNDFPIPCKVAPTDNITTIVAQLTGFRLPTFTEEIGYPNFKPKERLPPPSDAPAGSATKRQRAGEEGGHTRSRQPANATAPGKSGGKGKEKIAQGFVPPPLPLNLCHHPPEVLRAPLTAHTLLPTPLAPNQVTGSSNAPRTCTVSPQTRHRDHELFNKTPHAHAGLEPRDVPASGELESDVAQDATKHTLTGLARTIVHNEHKIPVKHKRPPMRWGSRWAVFAILWVLTWTALLPLASAVRTDSTHPTAAASGTPVARPVAATSHAATPQKRPHTAHPEINLNATAKPPSYRFKKRKRLKMSSNSSPLLHVLAWNVNGVLDEDKTYLLLDTLSSQWPDVKVVLLTETHLTESLCNPTLHSHPKWEVHRLDYHDSSGHTKQGGLVLLTARGQFAVSLLSSHPHLHVSAGTWRIHHTSWSESVDISGLYRPWPHGTAPVVSTVEQKQMEAFTELAEHHQQSPNSGLIVGDFNLHFGASQERLTHSNMMNTAPRVSEHAPPVTPNSLAAQALDIVNDHELFILNGRFGAASARHTFAPSRKRSDGTDVLTTVDYALAHQSAHERITNMKIDTSFSGPFDHRPLIITIKCPLLSRTAAPLNQTQWLPAVDRRLLDIQPMFLPAWEEDGVKQRYHDLLTENLEPCLRRMRTGVTSLARCPKLSGRLAKTDLCSQRTCICHTIEEEIQDIYENLTTGILNSASACLPRKPAPSESGARAHTTPASFWKPDTKWHELKQTVEKARKREANCAGGTPDELQAARDDHRAAYLALRLHTTESRARWMNKRLSVISLLAPAYTVKATWQVLKRQLGSDSQSGLPAVVKTARGDILKGQAATDHWHTAREAIGKFDPTAPFDTQAHKTRTLKLKQIRETPLTAPPPPHQPRDGSFDRLNDGITKAEVERALSKAKNGKAPGVDEIYNDFLTQGGDTIVEALRLLYNLVWSHERGPEAWNKALIRPLYKTATKDPLLTENYRAITLISTICKIYEAILCERAVAHLESTKRLSPSQGSRRFMGCEDLAYTITSTARSRHTHSSRGTYACFIDFKLAYPSTDHSVILTKLYDKGITGRLWRNIDGLYQHMQSHVLHPHIPDYDYFDIEVGVREGSVLSPILFLVAIDDMREYLMKHPFYPPRAQRVPGGTNAKGRAPGVWVGNTYLGLLQYVDDAVLLATSPQELQHMIKVIAQYCFENRLTLNPKKGKTEIVEFMCPPSGASYTVPLPTRENPAATAIIGVVDGYPYLGWWLDKYLTLDKHTTDICRKVSSATARVARMGGRPGGLPIRTTFQLWSALALPYVYGSVALLSHAQVDRIQHRLLEAVRQLAGRRVAPQAVLMDLGLPDVYLIRNLRISSLFARLRTLPTNLSPASLHQFLCRQPAARTTGAEGDMYSLLVEYGMTHLWEEALPPTQTLHTGLPPAPKGETQHDPIGHARRHLERQLQRRAWAHRGSQLRTGAAPFDDDKTRAYAICVANDLLRKDLQSCAPYLKANLSPHQEACMLLFRCQGSLLASHTNEADSNTLCDACELLPHTNQDVVEDAQHVLLHCCRLPFAASRPQFHSDMAEQCDEFSALFPDGSPITWRALDGETQTRLSLGDALPSNWSFRGLNAAESHAARRELQAALIRAAAPHLQDVASGLRAYRKAVAADTRAGNTTHWHNALRHIEQLGPALDEGSESDDE